MSLRFICIELRENLRCANVFLQFDGNLTNTDFMKINVKNDTLQITDKNTCICVKVSDHFLLDTRTLTNLTVEECNACFRLSLNDNEEGATNLQSRTHQIKKFTDLKPTFDVGDETTLHCSNCKCEIMGSGTILRMREFPMGTVNPSEFFCHAAPDFRNLLIPRICDLFYGFQFIVVNTELLDSAIKRKSGYLYCRRCLQYLGESLFEGKAAKLWTDALRLKNCDGVYGEVTATPTEAQLIQRVVDDCTDTSQPLLAMHFTKVLLEATFPDRSCKYLLMHILEKQLKVLRNIVPFEHANCNNNNNNILNVQLDDCRSYKLIYKFFDISESENGGKRNLPPLLQYWQQDISIQTLKISHKLFSSLLEELECNSMLVPEYYRFTNDEFKLSYIFYKN